MTFISIFASKAGSVQLPTFRHIVAAGMRSLAQSANRRRQKVELANLSERELRDVGMSISDVSSSTSAPLTFGGAQKLYELTLQRVCL